MDKQPNLIKRKGVYPTTKGIVALNRLDMIKGINPTERVVVDRVAFGDRDILAAQVGGISPVAQFVVAAVAAVVRIFMGCDAIARGEIGGEITPHESNLIRRLEEDRCDPHEYAGWRARLEGLLSGERSS